MTAWNGYIANCADCGKHGFDTRKSARAALKARHPGERMQAYRCESSGLWHYGHLPSSRALGRIVPDPEPDQVATRATATMARAAQRVRALEAFRAPPSAGELGRAYRHRQIARRRRGRRRSRRTRD